MATRLYLQSSGTPAVSPAFSAGWEVTTDADRIILTPKRRLSATTALTDKTVNIPNVTTQDILARQYISDPIPAQDFRGTVSLVVRVLESGLTANCTLAMVAWVVSQDGGTSRGTLFSVFSTDTEFPTAGATRIVNAQAVTNLKTQPGDRLVIEIGATATAPALTTATFRCGTSAASDFALTTALTTDLNPWVEFSQDIWRTDTNNYQFVKVGEGMSTSEKIR